MTYPLVWVVMGVSGSGKTTVGRCLAERLACDFLEGDRRHPRANVAKMAAGIPLDDGDRHQWLMALSSDIQRAVLLHRETVLTCSGLKRQYRQQFIQSKRVQLVWLAVPKAELQRRLAQRQNHYMGDRLLDSQLMAVDVIADDESAIQLDGMATPTAIVDRLLRQSMAKYPSLAQPWWQRH